MRYREKGTVNFFFLSPITGKMKVRFFSCGVDRDLPLEIKNVSGNHGQTFNSEEVKTIDGIKGKDINLAVEFAPFNNMDYQLRLECYEN